MWRHAVMGHRSPGMILRCRLREPDVARITRELPTLQGTNDSIAITNLAARRVHQICAPLHFADERIVEHVFRLWMQRSVDRDHIANTDHRFDIRVVCQVQLLLNVVSEPMAVRVM
jgi:hypothetical protein